MNHFLYFKQNIFIKYLKSYHNKINKIIKGKNICDTIIMIHHLNKSINPIYKNIKNKKKLK